MIIIGIVIFILGIIGVLLFWYNVLKYDAVYWFSAAMVIIGVYIILIAIALKVIKKSPIEYSSTEYRLEFKVTEFGESRDTTSVLIPKEKEQ